MPNGNDGPELVRSLEIIEGDDAITIQLGGGDFKALFFDATQLSYTNEGWKVRLHYHDEECTIRQRSKGNVEIQAPWVEKKSNRTRLGASSPTRPDPVAAHGIEDAWREAGKLLRGRHLDKETGGERLKLEPGDSRTWGQARQGLMENNLTGGARGMLALDIACAIYGVDTEMAKLDQGGIDHWYDVLEHTRRVEEDGEPLRYVAEWTVKKGTTEKVERFVFPQWFVADHPHFAKLRGHRPDDDADSYPISELTAFRNLGYLNAVLNRGGRYNLYEGSSVRVVPRNPLAALGSTKEGRGKPDTETRHAAEPERYSIVRQWGAWAEDAARRRGVIEELPTPESGRKRPKMKICDHVVPGIVEAMLYRSYRHGSRNITWRHDRADEVALDPKALSRLFDLAEKRRDRKGRKLNQKKSLKDLKRLHEGVWKAGIIAWVTKIKVVRILPFPEEDVPFWQDYLKAREEMLEKLKIESEWLFPDPYNPARPIDTERAVGLLRLAEKRARWDLICRGLDPDEYVKIVGGTQAYTWRHGIETNRSRLGYENTKSSQYVGGRAIEGDTATTKYAQAFALEILDLIRGATRVEAIAKELGLKIEIVEGQDRVARVTRSIRGELLPREGGE